uniref:CCHC-type domain-containing protein n=1 Tax=Sander lucioperca TaxID=283035 RepID=A0A8C9X1X9_SANLU
MFVSLATPAKKVLLSNVPPFISDEALSRELSQHGKIVSQIRKVPSGCKSPLFKHVVSHRRYLHMILHNRSVELNLVFKLRVDDFDYIIFATSDNMKCFSCGREGHLSRACPGKNVTSGQTFPNKADAGGKEAEQQNPTENDVKAR